MPTTGQHPVDETLTGPTETTERRTVRIPGSAEHAGHHLMIVTLQWVCPRCAGPRGPIRSAISYDGSRRLHCDGWSNPCGHIDYYHAVRAEAEHSTETL